MKDKEKQNITMKEMLTKTSFEPITNCNCEQVKDGDLLNQQIEAMKYFASENSVSMFDIMKNCEHKAKAIEEMAKVIENVKLYGTDNYERKISRDSVLELAEELLKYYQPKLPEDSVVIPNKITEETSAEDLIKIAKYNDKIRKQANKETAEKILERGKYCMPSGLREWIVEQFGVEIKE